MSITEFFEKIKPFYNLILGLCLAVIFFALGRLSVLKSQEEPITVSYGSEALVFSTINNATTTTGTTTKSVLKTETPTLKTDGEVIGSKSGKKYYFPWCGTVKRIKPENQVHFTSIAEAKAAGFIPGGNCKGLW